MINERDRRRVGQARLLRRQGKTYDEIRAIIGEVSDDALRAWLRGIPRPPGTFRGNPHTSVRRRCRELRLQGMTYDEIAATTGASKSSLSLWLRDMPYDVELAQVHRTAAVRASCMRARATRLAARADQVAGAAEQVGSISDRELFLIGLGLYWAEGTKNKPWAMRDRITFTNSDPTMILVFLRWLDLVGVSRDRCHFRIQIHESADITAAEKYWASLVGVPADTLYRTTLKRHNPKTTRRNTGDGYRGCLVVDVMKSAALYRAVEGWWQGVASGVEAAFSLAEPIG